ncbi:MAG TPA: ribosome silencing factor [Alphaproteobacteria bacterium]|nr:ribosome silencing factor [Alphaproteobacteria bacterium]
MAKRKATKAKTKPAGKAARKNPRRAAKAGGKARKPPIKKTKEASLKARAKTRKPARPARKSPRKAAAPQAARRPRGLPEELKDAALKVLDDRQAENVVAIDLAGKSSLADYLIIADGRAARQISAIADYLRDAFQKLGAPRVRVEGLPQGDWVLVDAGDVVVHLFRPDVRRYYDLEGIWGNEADLERASLLIE